jgi:hypothetical protein
MMTFVVLYGAIALFASAIVLLDYFGRRQLRNAAKIVERSSPSAHADDFWP